VIVVGLWLVPVPKAPRKWVYEENRWRPLWCWNQFRETWQGFLSCRSEGVPVFNDVRLSAHLLYGEFGDSDRFNVIVNLAYVKATECFWCRSLTILGFDNVRSGISGLSNNLWVSISFLKPKKLEAIELDINPGSSWYWDSHLENYRAWRRIAIYYCHLGNQSTPFLL